MNVAVIVYILSNVDTSVSSAYYYYDYTTVDLVVIDRQSVCSV